MINGVGEKKAEINIVPNNIEYLDKNFIIERHPTYFENYSYRKPIANKNLGPNEKRFDNFNREPDIYTKKKHTAIIKFDKMAARNPEKGIYKTLINTFEYENADRAKDQVMR